MSRSRLKFRLFASGLGGEVVILPPAMTSGSAISLSENAALFHTVTANQSGVTWAKVGGADAAEFTLEAASLSLAAQDFENPINPSNQLVVWLQPTSTLTGLVGLVYPITVTITDVDETIPLGGTNYPYPPKLKTRELVRTILVPAGDEVMDIQSEFALPMSPSITAVIIGGADAAKLTAQSAGRYVFTEATRAALAGTVLNITVEASNAYGTCAATPYTIRVPADTDCRFASWETGIDTANGQSPAAAWKRAPGAAGWAGTGGIILGAGKYLFFRGHGEKHRYGLWKSTSGYSPLDHTGTTGNPMGYQLSGWGGRAIFDGADLIEGWAPATELEVSGNPNWAQIEVLDLTSQGGAAWWAAHLFCGDEIQWPAQFPTPADLAHFEGPDDATETQGMWRVAVGGGSNRKMVQTKLGVNAADTSIVTVTDDRAGGAMGAVSPRAASIWKSGNDIVQGDVTGYSVDAGVATIAITFPGVVALNNVNGMTAYCLHHHPLQIAEVGQFAYSADRTKVYAWRSNDEATSISRRARGMTVSKSYVSAVGGQWQGFANEIVGSNFSRSGGCAFVNGASAMCNEVFISDHVVRHNRADGGDGCAYYGSGSGGTIDGIIERILIKDVNPRASGIRIGNIYSGFIGGTRAQVAAHAYGKIRDNFVDTNAIGRTVIALFKAEGLEISGNCWRDLLTVHGNGISLYDSGSGEGGYTRRILVWLNYGDNSERCYTVSVSNTADKAIDRVNWIERNVFVGALTGYVVALYSGEPGSTLLQNIILGGPDYVHSGGTLYIDDGQRVAVNDNVVGGIDAEGTGSDAYSIVGNLLTKNSLPAANGTTRIVSGNIVATGAPFQQWDHVLTAEMALKLGVGELGVFHAIAA